MSESAAGRWGMRAAALVRALRSTLLDPRGRRVAGRTQLGKALWAGVSAAVAGVRGALGVLWFQVTGFFFAVFAVIGGGAAWREYQRYAAGQIGPGRALLAAAFSLVFTWFAASSFWRARSRNVTPPRSQPQDVNEHRSPTESS